MARFKSTSGTQRGRRDTRRRLRGGHRISAHRGRLGSPVALWHEAVPRSRHGHQSLSNRFTGWRSFFGSYTWISSSPLTQQSTLSNLRVYWSGYRTESPGAQGAIRSCIWPWFHIRDIDRWRGTVSVHGFCPPIAHIIKKRIMAGHLYAIIPLLRPSLRVLLGRSPAHAPVHRRRGG